MTDNEMRVEALRHALIAQRGNEKPEQTVARAKKFLAFLRDPDAVPGAAPAKAVPAKAAPAKKPAAKAAPAKPVAKKGRSK